MFRMQLGSWRFSFKIHGFISPGKLVNFQYWAWVLFCGVGLKPRVQIDSCWLPPRYVCPYCTHRFCSHGGSCHGSQASQLGRTVALLLPSLDACMAPSGTMKASPQEGGFQVRSSSGPLDPVPEVHRVFISRDLLFISDRQPRAIAVDYNVLGVLWTTLTSNSKEGFSCLVLGFLLDSGQLLGEALPVYKENLFKVYTQTYMHSIYFEVDRQ